MKTATTSVLGRLCGGVSIAILALGLTFGAARTARADEVEMLAPTPQEMVVAPILKAMDVLVERIARLEESVALFTATVNSQRLATRQLCVSDESGAETCITKAQLDGLIKRFAQAEVSEPAVIVAIAVPAAEPQATETPAADDPAAEAPLTEPATAPADAIETIPAREVMRPLRAARASRALPDRPSPIPTARRWSGIPRLRSALWTRPPPNGQRQQRNRKVARLFGPDGSSVARSGGSAPPDLCFCALITHRDVP